MIHIPVEVLREIFTNLNLKDKLACMLVCRLWYDTLDRFTLLRHISIDNTRFPKFKAMLARFPHRLSQVKCLELSGCLDPEFAERELCNIILNVQELKLRLFTTGNFQLYTSESLQYLHSTCKLEKLVETGGGVLASKLAMSNVCSNLKTLELNFEDLDDLDYNKVISQLKNMPFLQHFQMRNLRFKLMDLEEMHSNLPSIKSLHLKVAHLASGEIPRDVLPASLVTELEVDIHRSEHQDTNIQFYKYIGNKYPSVRNLILEDETSYYGDGADSTPRVYNEGIFPLYQKIASQVDNFIFNDYYQGLDAFKKFDDYGMKLKDLTIRMTWMFDDIPFIEELVQSQQHKYIKKLVLEDIIPESISTIRDLEVLETLDISSSYFFDPDERVMRKEINLSQLIDACPPTLTTLIIINMNLTYDEPTSSTTSIRHLTITNVKISSVLTNILETKFPELSTLTLTGDITNNVTISLLMSSLKEVNFTAMYDQEENRNEYSSESRCDNGIHYHTIKRTPTNEEGCQLYTYYGRAKPVTKIEPVESFALKFICPSVEQLSFSTARKLERY